MAVSNNLLREYIRARLIEACELPDSAYTGISTAIRASAFWTHANTDEDADYAKVPHVGEFNQTPAAQSLQYALQDAFDKTSIRIIFAVQSADPYDSPSALITSDHRAYPDGIVMGGYATITNNGRQAVIINMGVYDVPLNDVSFNAARTSRKVAGILRHELRHFKQCDVRAAATGVSRSRAFKDFQNDPKAIPDRDAKKYWEIYEKTDELDESGEPVIRREGFKKALYHADYISSYIEIDAHAYQAADELLDAMDFEAAVNLLRSGNWTSLGADLPEPVEEYLIKSPNTKLANKFRKKVLANLESLESRGVFKESYTPKVMLHVNGIKFGAEIADCQKTRSQGLMGRLSLEENAGMLFVFDDVKPRSFWMKETYIPLSIAYLDKHGKIINIEAMSPLNLQGVRSMQPAKYAIEMSEGWFSKNNVVPGNIVKLTSRDNFEK